MKVIDHDSVEALEKLESEAEKPAFALKLRALILARQGWPAVRIAEALGKTDRSIQGWIQLYNQHGLEALREKRGGNHVYLTPDQENQLKAHLEAKANDPHDGVRFAYELLPLIQERFGVTYSLSGLYVLLHRLGYEWLSPRPRHVKNDPDVVEAFKKTPRRLSPRSPGNTREKTSKSGSRMKRVLDNKEP
jgi:transposase